MRIPYGMVLVSLWFMGAPPWARSGETQQAYLPLSDEALFSALDLSHSGLEEIRAAVDRKDFNSAYAAWGKYWAKRKAPVHFIDATRYGKQVKESLPAIARQVVADSDELWKPGFESFNYKPKRVGTRFQWVDSTQDTSYIGFLYFFWTRGLGRAYVLTGDRKYAELFQEIVTTFLDDAPGIRADALWNSGLGSALRPVVWMESYWLLRERPDLAPKFHAAMLKIFLSHARYVFDQIKRGYSDHNIQASQASWMVCAGVLLPEFKEAAAWRAMGVARAKQRIGRCFTKDGCHLEYCPMYHTAGLRDLTRAALLLKANGLTDFSGDPVLWKQFQQAFEFTFRITHPTGHMSVFNSSSYSNDAQVYFPIGMRLFDSPLLKWAAQRYIKDTYVPLNKGISEYIMFIDGGWAEAVQNARAAKPPPPNFKNDLLEDTGLAVLRSGWEENAQTLVFDFNRQTTSGHSHLGRLSFDLFAFGEALAVQPGSTLSYSMPVYGEWCTQTLSHNTVLVNNASQTLGSPCRLLAWQDGKRTAFVAAETDAYKGQGVNHRRGILAVSGEYFLILDCLMTTKGGLPLSWLLHCPLEMNPAPNGSACTPAGKPGLLVVPDSATAQLSTLQFGKGYGAVPVNFKEGFKALDMWRSDIPFLRLDTKTEEKLGGQAYAVLLAPFASQPPKARVVCEAVPGQTRLQTYRLRIDAHGNEDLVTVEWTGPKPVCRIQRLKSSKGELWSE